MFKKGMLLLPIVATSVLVVQRSPIIKYTTSATNLVLLSVHHASITKASWLFQPHTDYDGYYKSALRTSWTCAMTLSQMLWALLDHCGWNVLMSVSFRVAYELHSGGRRSITDWSTATRRHLFALVGRRAAVGFTSITVICWTACGSSWSITIRSHLFRIVYLLSRRV